VSGISLHADSTKATFNGVSLAEVNRIVPSPSLSRAKWQVPSRSKMDRNKKVSVMPSYSFRISHGKFSGASESVFDLADQDAAWAEMTKVCGDLVGSICRGLKQESDWQMELLDDSKNPSFRIRLVAETLV
jgi:hypothetical protein